MMTDPIPVVSVERLELPQNKISGITLRLTLKVSPSLVRVVAKHSGPENHYVVTNLDITDCRSRHSFEKKDIKKPGCNILGPDLTVKRD